MVTTSLLLLAGGMLAVVSTGRFDQIAWGFLRLVGMIVLALGVGVTIWHLQADSQETSWDSALIIALGATTSMAAIFMVLAAPVAQRIPRWFSFLCLFGGLAGLGAASVSALHGFPGRAQFPSIAAVAVVVSQMLGASLLGSITIAWLLGHAYLTATKMTIAPLQHFSRMLSWAVAVRIGFAVLSLAGAWFWGQGSDVSAFARLRQAWIILLFRGGVGLAAVAVFAYMVADCVRRRSTQSATGILYFGSIFAYVGELANQQIISEYGWPL